MSQRDALVIESGVLDAEFLINDQTLTTSVKMSGLKLAKNANSERDDILFIPVDRLIDYVNRESQNLELTFELDQQGFQTSDDLDALGGEVWDGLWKAVLRKAVLVDKEDLGKQIKGKIGDFLKKARKP